MESQSGGGSPRGAGARRPFFRRRKSCPFSGPNATKIDYKDVKLLQRFVSERGKIVPSRVKAIPDARVGNQFDLGATGAGPGVSLVASIPAVDEFPIAAWERLRAQVLTKKGVNLLRYSSNRGHVDLRKAIAASLGDLRTARCHP